MSVSHPFLKKNKIEKRIYQEEIAKKAVYKNTLVVLPTGLGKTVIAVLVAAERLRKYPGSGVLVLAPTKPLASQHARTFSELMEAEVSLVTGSVPKNKRKELYRSDVVVATPQTVENDLDIINLGRFSLLVVDEAHRCVGKYAYTNVVKKYIELSSYPRILGLTASPGASREKIREICKNLCVDHVELRTEEDEDVKPYLKGFEISVVRVNLAGPVLKARDVLKNKLRERIDTLKDYGFRVFSKKDVIQLQKNTDDFRVSLICAEAIKLWHLIELLETQSPDAAMKFYLSLDRARPSERSILDDPEIRGAMNMLAGTEHPKMKELVNIVKDEMERNPEARIIVFSHFRDNIEKIKNVLSPHCSVACLVGQSGERGLTQKEQIETIKKFEKGEFSCLVTSPVGEEGLHIPSVDIGIFYDSVPSEIRTIQRRGRVGRVKMGKVIFLVTRKTRDEAYFYIARRKERKMKEILKNMGRKESLLDFI
ncbi:MAG: DEAD/DEAH box helicase [Candidatus Micrarchaeota archaeon]|nr:DEAD/DEAH box helicase [Candidatus Micrarchaeota archaeon]